MVVARCQANENHPQSFSRFKVQLIYTADMVLARRIQSSTLCKCSTPIRYTARNISQASVVPPRIVGAGEAKTSTPISPPARAWYKQPRVIRNLVNILLLASFANSADMILSYKSQKREITWQSKERIATLKDTIEKVRRGEEVDIRAALGTGDPEMEKRWAEGIFNCDLFF